MSELILNYKYYILTKSCKSFIKLCLINLTKSVGDIVCETPSVGDNQWNQLFSQYVHHETVYIQMFEMILPSFLKMAMVNQTQ